MQKTRTFIFFLTTGWASQTSFAVNQQQSTKGASQDTGGKLGAQDELCVSQSVRLLSINPQHVNVTFELDMKEAKRKHSAHWIITLPKINVNSNHTR